MTTMPNQSVSNPRKRPAAPIPAGSDPSRPLAGERRDADRHHVRTASADQGPWPDLDRLIHERLRLGIVSALAVNQTMTFNDLRNLLTVCSKLACLTIQMQLVTV